MDYEKDPTSYEVAEQLRASLYESYLKALIDGDTSEVSSLGLALAGSDVYLGTVIEAQSHEAQKAFWDKNQEAYYHLRVGAAAWAIRGYIYSCTQIQPELIHRVKERFQLDNEWLREVVTPNEDLIYYASLELGGSAEDIRYNCYSALAKLDLLTRRQRLWNLITAATAPFEITVTTEQMAE